MATAILQTAEDQITCTICFDIFSEPKALPCLHTFCKECISKFITERKNQHGDKKGYVCPICRRPVAVPTHLRNNPETWANQLENNHAVSTMIDAYKTPRGKTMETCTEHPEKELEFFCVDHTKFICSMCSLQHRRCSDVITREEGKIWVKNSKTKTTSVKDTKQGLLKQCTDMFLEQCNAFEHVLDKRRNDMEFLDSAEERIREEIISSRKQINELLNKYEEKALTRLAKLKTKSSGKIEKEKRKLESFNESSRGQLERIQKMMDSKQEVTDTFTESIQTDHASLQRKLKAADSKQMREHVTFAINPTLRRFISEFDSFGKLSLKDNETNDPRNSMEHTVSESKDTAQHGKESTTGHTTANSVKELKLPFRGKPSWITGITALPSGRLLLVDHTNEAVSAYDSSFNFLCKTDVHPAPYDVVSISKTADDVMISIPDAKELLHCDVMQDGFVEKGQKLKTNNACKALDSDKQHLAVCSSSEIQIFEKDGDAWMAVLEESYSRTKFTYITLTSSERKVFVSDQTYPEPHIRCIDFNGDTLWKVANGRIGFTTGVCVIGTKVLITSWDSGTIFSLSFNGRDLEVFNEGSVLSPWKIHVCSGRNIVCVSQYKNALSEEDKRTIKVIQMTR